MSTPINRTPAHLRCAIGTCPSVYEITPEHLQCPVGECQAVFEAEGELLIIGKKPSPERMANIEGRVGEDEQAIVIGKEYFSDLFQAPQNQDGLLCVHPDLETKARELACHETGCWLKREADAQPPHDQDCDYLTVRIHTALREAVAAEREKCALTVENFSRLLAATIRSAGGRDPVAAILARGEAK